MRCPRTIAALIDKRVRLAFGRQPLLVGFTIDGELTSAQVELARCAGHDWSERVYAEILLELCALVEDLGEQTVPLLAGRTFARALH